MTGGGALSAGLALGWSLLLTLGLFTVAVLVAVLFGGTNTAIIVAGPAELLLMLPAAALIVRAYGPADRRVALGLGAVSGVELLVGASLGVILHLPTGYLSELIERVFPTPPAVWEAQLRALTPSSALVGALMLLSVAVIVPFAEELFFRGALFSALLRGGPPFVAIATTSVAFAIAHQEPRNWAPLLVVALVLAELRRRGGSIWAGVALHATFNAATLCLVFMTRPKQIEPQAGAWQLGLLGTLLCASGIWVFARAAGRRLGGAEPA